MRTHCMYRCTAGVLISVMAGTLLPMVGAYAGSAGRRNTAWAATAAAAYLGYRYAQKPSTGRLIPAAAAVGATGLAWIAYNKAHKREKAQQQAQTWEYGRRAGYRQAVYDRAGYRTAAYRGHHRWHGHAYGHHRRHHRR